MCDCLQQQLRLRCDHGATENLSLFLSFVFTSLSLRQRERYLQSFLPPRSAASRQLNHLSPRLHPNGNRQRLRLLSQPRPHPSMLRRCPRPHARLPGRNPSPTRTNQSLQRPCLVNVTLLQPCASTDFRCLCAHASQIQIQTLTCINGTCSTQDEQTAVNYYYSYCNRYLHQEGPPLPSISSYVPSSMRLALTCSIA